MVIQFTIHELHFELLPHPPFSPDLAPSDYFLFADLKRMLQGKRFKAYFKAKDKSFYKKRHRIVREALESVNHPKGDYVDE